MKNLRELINREEPAWELIQNWLKDATNTYEILEKDMKRAEEELLHAQVTTRSILGAVIYETGGILIDSSFIRILGSGSERLDRAVMKWNEGKTYQNLGEQIGYLLVADDIVGGYFAINGGALSGRIGNIFYLAPDTLEWEDLECGYSEFLYWAFTGNLDLFYENVRWRGWKEEMNNINANQTISFYPFLFTKEGKDINKSERKIIPVEESYRLSIEMKKALDGEK